MLGWIKLPAISAKRLVGASARDAFRDRFHASAVVMAFFGTSAANLWSVALIGFVIRDLLAIIALFWAVPAFKRLGGPGFSSGKEEPFVDEPPCFRASFEVNNH